MLKRCLKLRILIVIYYKLSSHLGVMIIIICIYDDKFDDSHHSKETDLVITLILILILNLSRLNPKDTTV